MDTTQSTQESQELDTAQPTPEHQAHIAETEPLACHHSRIQPKHLKEWVEDSGVSPGITNLCLSSLDNRSVVAKKIGWKKYPTNFSLGWFVSGLDLTTMQPQEFGQYKPDIAIQFPEKEKPTRYISDKGHSYDAIALPHPDPEYWQRVLDDVSIPVDVDEGLKKSGCGMTCGFPSLALPGVTMWQRKGELVPNLAAVAVPGRTIRIRFDMDLLFKKGVLCEVKKLAKALEEKGCTVLVAMWDEELGLKIDDVKVKHGPEMVEKIMADAVPYAEWLKSLKAKAQVSRLSDRKKASETKNKDGKSKTPVWGQDTLAKYIAEKYRAKLAWHIDAQCWMRYEAENKGIWGEEPEEVVKSVVTAELDDVARRKAYGKHQAQIEEHLAQIEEALEKGQTNVAQKLDQKLEELEEKGPDEPPPYTHGFVSGVMSFTQSFLAVKHWDLAASSGLIPLKNGVFDYKTKKFSEHNSGNKITWTLPYDYNPVATCEPIVSWLNETAGDKQVARLLVAYLRAILTNRTDIHRLLELVGPGGSGKSTYARLAQALIGTQNTHTTTLAKLEGSRFETACLWNKRLAIVNDSERYAGNVTILKAASGGDTIPHEVKFVQSRRGFIFDGKFILTSNEIIQSSDYTSGLERRRITIPFTNRIPVEYQRNLIEIKGDVVSGEFTECLPGLFNLIISMPDEEMEALLRNTDKFCPALGESKAENLIDINPIAAWMDYCIIHDPEARTQIGLAIPDKDRDSQTTYLNVGQWLYPSYCEYSKNSGSRTPLGLQRFVKLLDDLAKNQLKLDGVEREKDRAKKSYFKGLRIRQNGTDDDLPSPIFGRASEKVRGDMRGDCGGICGGMKPIQRRDAGDAEGLLKNSDNIFQDSPQNSFDTDQILQNNAICEREFSEIPSASPEVPRCMDLNPPHIPPHIPPHPSALNEAQPYEQISIALPEPEPEPETAPTPPTAQSIAPLIEKVTAAQTWAEVATVWGDDLELKNQIKAQLPKDELKRIGKLYKQAHPSPSPTVEAEPAEPATTPTEPESIETPAQLTDTSSETQPEPGEPTPEPTPEQPTPATETTPTPTPEAEFKVGDRVRVSMRKGKFKGKCGEIFSISPKSQRGSNAATEFDYGVCFDREGRRKTVDRLSLSASQIELIGEVAEDE